MGLFDFFLSEEKQIERHVRRLTDRDSSTEDREASAKWLSEKGTPYALGGLLQRFDLSLEHQLKDSGEKEQVFNLLRAHGVKILDVSKVWLRQCKQIAMPLKLVGEVAGVSTQIDIAVDLLKFECEKDDFKVDKKKQLLTWMVGVKDPRCGEGAASMLKDFDEGLRYTAVEVLIGIPGDVYREQLENVFRGERELSGRLAAKLADAFVQRGWAFDESLASQLPPGFRWSEGRVVRS